MFAIVPNVAAEIGTPKAMTPAQARGDLCEHSRFLIFF